MPFSFTRPAGAEVIITSGSLEKLAKAGALGAAHGKSGAHFGKVCIKIA